MEIDSLSQEHTLVYCHSHKRTTSAMIRVRGQHISGPGMQATD